MNIPALCRYALSVLTPSAQIMLGSRAYVLVGQHGERVSALADKRGLLRLQAVGARHTYDRMDLAHGLPNFRYTTVCENM